MIPSAENFVVEKALTLKLSEFHQTEGA